MENDDNVLIPVAQLEEIIRELGNNGDPFTSHQVITLLTERHASAYIEMLYNCRFCNDPFQTCHSKIGKQLAQIQSLEKLDRVSDTNIRLKISENQSWRIR